MRILQINSMINFGGGEKHVCDLANGFAQKRHEVFVCLRENSAWQDRLVNVEKEKIFSLPLRNSFDLLSAKRLANFLRDNKIEILHAHTARDYAISAMAVRLNPKTKLVLTRHVLFPMKRLQKFMLGNVSKVIAVSSAVETQLKTQRLFPAEKIVAIPNGIEIEHWANVDKEQLRKNFRNDHNIAESDFLIGIVGELKQQKGQEEFVLASQEIAKKFSNAKFVIVGKDNSFDQKFRLKLRRLIKVFGLTEKFVWLDWVDDTVNLLSSLDVFVSASHTESFGLAIVEAMASGCAIVATATDGAKEILDNGNYGKIVPIRDAFEISTAVGKILQNPQSQRALGEKAQQYATEKFGLQRMIDETEKVYLDLQF